MWKVLCWRLTLALVAVVLPSLLPSAASVPASHAGTARLPQSQSAPTLPAQAGFRVDRLKPLNRNPAARGAIHLSDTSLVAEVNAARLAVGQPHIGVVDMALTNMARAHNDEMARCAAAQGWGSTCVAHQVPGGKDFPTRLAAAGYGTGGEVLARAYADAGAAVDGWLTSSPHRSILLDGLYNRIGCAEDRYGSHAEAWLYTCVLAYTRNTPTPAAWPTQTPVVLPTRTPRSTLTPSPTVRVGVTPTPSRGPLPAGWLMRIFVPDSSFDLPTCHRAGLSCYREYRVSYDDLNRLYPNPWDITDDLFYRFCPNPVTLNAGNLCEWQQTR